MALTSPSRDLYPSQNTTSSIYLPFLSPTVTPSHEDSDPYHELLFVPFQPPTKIDLGTTHMRESRSCKLNIFNPKDVLMTALLTAPSESSAIRIETLRLPIADADNPLPTLKDSHLYHLPPNSSALIRITWTPVTPDDLYTSLVFKWGCRFTSKVALYGKVHVITRKSQRVLFGDTQVTFTKQNMTSAFRAPLSSLAVNSPPVDKSMNPIKPYVAINPVSSHTFIDVDDSALSLPSQSFIASTPMERNSVKNRFHAKNQDVSMVAAERRNLTFSVNAPGAGVFDSHWADKQICAFTHWLNFILSPQDSSNFTSIQSDNSPPIKKYSINLTTTFRGLNSPSDTILPSGEPRYSVTQRKYLYHLRSKMRTLYSSTQFTSTLYTLHAEIEKCRLKIRAEKPVWKDVGLKEDLLRTILSYHPLWLRLGIEAVFNCTIPVTHEMDSKTIHRFLTLNLFSSRNISAKFSHRRVPGLFTKGYDLAISKHITFKYFTLILFLDLAKQQKLINHDPCLFKGSRVKSSREMLLYFSSSFLQGEGDVTKHLSNLGYRVSHKQSFLDEFDYKVKNLAVDLRDGVRLSRLLELLTQDWSLSHKLRIPATSMTPKLANNKLFLDKLKEVTQIDLGISSRDIAIGHREKTLSLIWALIFHFRVAIKLDEFLLRREIAYIRAKHSIHDNYIPNKRSGNQGSDQLNSNTLELLLEWCSVINSVFGIRVTDFTSSFKDGRALCYILHYYHPSLLSRHFICEDAKSNLEEFSDKLSSLGGVPTLPPPSDFFQTGPNEKVVIMYLSYLCAQQLELSEEIRAAVVIQRAYKLYTYRLQQNQLEQSSYDSQLCEFHEQTQAAVTIQSIYRSYLVRRDISHARDSRERVLHEKTTAALTLQRCYRVWSAKQLAISSRNNYLSLKSTVISIQRIVRKNIKRKREIIELRANELVHRIITTSFIEVNREYELATLKIQRMFREFKARRELTQLREDRNYLIQQRHLATMEQSVVIIQSVYRGCKARGELTILKRQFNEIYLQNLSSSTIQNVIDKTTNNLQQERLVSIHVIQKSYRQWSANIFALSQRKNYLSLKSIVITLQQVFRRYLQDKKQLHELIEQSTLTIQSVYRGYKARGELTILKRQYNEIYLQNLSSSTIQLVIDKTVANLSQERQNAISTLQNSYRRWSANRLALSARENYLSLKTSVILIQRAVRRYIQHKRISSYLIQKTADNLVHNILTLSHTLVTKELVQSVITLQSMYRYVIARKELSFLRKQNNETILSTYLNSFVERIIMESKINLQQERLISVIRIQNCYRRWSANKLALSTRKNYLSLKSNVISLQHFIRIHLEDKKHKYELKLSILSDVLVDKVNYNCVTILSQEILLSTISIQQWYRQYSANKLAISIRNKYISMRKSVISIQRAFRKHHDDNEILSREKAAICIQSHFRTFLIRSEYISQRSAVILIQQTFRTCPVYMRNRQAEIDTRSAITIQSFFRGYLIRQNMESSLLSIKRRLSDATKSADISDQLKNKIPKYLDILLHSRSLSQKYDILDNLKTAVYVSEPCAIRVRREGLNILYMLVDNNVRSPSIMQRVEKAADVLLQMTKWPSIANDVFIYGQSIPIITDLLQKIYTTQPSTVRILCHLLIAFCKHPDQVATMHSMHNNSIQKMHKLLTILKRKYSVGANRMLSKARKDLAQSIHDLERVFTHFRYIT